MKNLNTSKKRVAKEKQMRRSRNIVFKGRGRQRQSERQTFDRHHVTKGINVCKHQKQGDLVPAGSFRPQVAIH